jgi:3-mercaptopyruvate sulfurtransferase SseA
VRSAASYGDNTAGLVTVATLRRWLTDWTTQRPEGVTGDLVILQTGPAPTEGPYAAPAPGVRVYDADDLPMLLQHRSNGVLASGRSPGRGVRVDSYLRRYGIRPTKDLVLLAAGSGPSTEALADLARAWLTLRYWGLDHRTLAVLRDGVDRLEPTLRGAAALEPPVDGPERVPSLGRDHRVLVAGLGDVRAAVTGGGLLVDTRDREEFDGGRLSASAFEDTCPAGAGHCTALFSGRIAGARHVPLAGLFDADGRLAPRDGLDAAFRASGVPDDAVAIVYDADGTTGAIAAFARLAVAGKPARWYAGGFVEWASLGASHPAPALRSLPSDSPWRLDLPHLTEGLGLHAAVEAGARPLILDSAAARASALFDEDLAYLRTPPPMPAPGAGDSVCADR